MKSPVALTILKIGGNVLADADQLHQTLALFTRLAGPAILVHGGGRRADELLAALGHKAQMVNGRRLTDAPTLEVVTMVYAGLLNKQLVALLQAQGCNALGVSGADGNLLRAHQRPVQDIDYGFAGDIDAVNVPAFQALLGARFAPVCCAITHDGAGQLLNTNADTIAASIATALAPHYAVALWYCFEKPGVLLDINDDQSVIPVLDPARYAELKSQGVIHSGMLPKLDNAFATLQQGVQEVQLGNLASLTRQKATRIIFSID
ncbi:MAG: acetylglutamate kinase [Bacteroidetes bacterium]|nr:MAG: acetylglutamate kinase [Bacteroidota bacterium]PTM11433.1 MAG: acetylglutamate kinase [Bacteroidota bacterium]